MTRLKFAVLVFLAALAVFGVDTTRAAVMDRVVECNRVHMGALGRIQGFGGHTEWVKKEKHKEYALADYRGAMYIRDDGETDDEKKAWDDALTLGWKLEDAYMKTHAGNQIDPKEILEHCMQQEDSSAGRFYHAQEHAQNENLGNPSAAHDRGCDFMHEILLRAVPMKGRFDSVDEMLKVLPFEESWSPELAANAKAQITGLFAFTGSSKEYIQQSDKACVQGK